MSVQKPLSKEQLLDLLKSPEKNDSSKNYVRDGDVPAFLRHFNVIEGNDYVNPLVLFFLYKNWSSKKLTFVKFKVIIKRYVANNKKGFFYNSLAANFTAKDLYDATKSHFQKHRQEISSKEKKPTKHK